MTLETPPLTEILEPREWVTADFLALFDHGKLAEGYQRASDNANARRAFDFIASPGKITARVHGSGGTLQRVDILFSVIDEDSWERVINEMAGQSACYAALLAGTFPKTIGNIFRQAGVNLLPEAISDLQFQYDSKSCDAYQREMAVLIIRFAERLELDPWLLVQIRGKGREELLSQFRLRRASLPRPEAGDKPEPDEPKQQATREAPSKAFWEADMDLWKMHYSIKADELPAAILRRLDPMPLRGLEEKFDPQLEEAYVRIARRAQAYGISLEREASAKKEEEEKAEQQKGGLTFN